MASFTFCISTDGAVFHAEDGSIDPAEVVELLRDAAMIIENQEVTNGVNRLRDSNGNRVGYFVFQGD